MTYIIITDDITRDHIFEEDIEAVNIEGLYHLLNPREIGISIALQLFDADYDIKQEYLDEEINDYLKDIHEKILEECINVLEDNGREVL